MAIPIWSVSREWSVPGETYENEISDNTRFIQSRDRVEFRDVTDTQCDFETKDEDDNQEEDEDEDEGEDEDYDFWDFILIMSNY